MQVKYIAESPREHSAIISTFIKLPFVIKIFVLSIFEWPLKTGFTMQNLWFYLNTYMRHLHIQTLQINIDERKKKER